MIQEMSWDATWRLPSGMLDAPTARRVIEASVAELGHRLDPSDPGEVEYDDYRGALWHVRIRDSAGAFELAEDAGGPFLRIESNDGDNRDVWDELCELVSLISQRLGGPVDCEE